SGRSRLGPVSGPPPLRRVDRQHRRRAVVLLATLALDPTFPRLLPPARPPLARLLALALGQVVVIAEVLAGHALQLLAGAEAHVVLRMHQPVDHPLDAMAPGVLLPPRAPLARLGAEILLRQLDEGAARLFGGPL